MKLDPIGQLAVQAGFLCFCYTAFKIIFENFSREGVVVWSGLAFRAVFLILAFGCFCLGLLLA